MCVFGGQRCCLQLLSTLFSETGSFTEPELRRSAKLADLCAPGIRLSLPTQFRDGSHCWCLTCCCNSTCCRSAPSSPCVCSEHFTSWAISQAQTAIWLVPCAAVALKPGTLRPCLKNKQPNNKNPSVKQVVAMYLQHLMSLQKLQRLPLTRC